MDKLVSMRPQDVVIALWLTAHCGKGVTIRQSDVAYGVMISQSEVSQSLHRLIFSGLLGKDKGEIHKRALLEFLLHGLRYVYPIQPGRIAVGVPCAHSAPPFAEKIISNEAYVWPYPEGSTRGVGIQPLFSSVPKIALQSPVMYSLLSACEMLRLGRPREIELAKAHLNGMFFSKLDLTSHL